MKRVLKYFLPLMLILTLMSPMQTYAAVGAVPAPQAVAGTITFEDALQQALMLYINSGLDQNTAMARLQVILPQLIANPAAFLQIVQADLAALGILPGAVPMAAPSPVGASLIQAQQAQQAAALQAQQQAAIQAQQAELLRQQQEAAAIQAQQVELLRQQQEAAAIQAQQAEALRIQQEQQAELLRQQQAAAALQAQQAAAQAAMTHAVPVSAGVTYIGNRNSMKFHYPSCSSVQDMAVHNMVPFYGGRNEVISQGYVPCKRCHP